MRSANRRSIRAIAGGVRARNVRDSELGIGFVVLSDFVFDTGGLLVDPNADALRRKLERVRRLHLSLYSILVAFVGATILLFGWSLIRRDT